MSKNMLNAYKALRQKDRLEAERRPLSVGAVIMAVMAIGSGMLGLLPLACLFGALGAIYAMRALWGLFACGALRTAIVKLGFTEVELERRALM